MKKEDAIKLFDSKFWEEMTLRERAIFQISEPLLCMPFSIFHEAVEKTLKRPVYTHEFGLNVEGLRAELLDGASAPSIEVIINMIPENKRIIVTV